MQHSWLVLHGSLVGWMTLGLFLVCGWAAPVFWLRWRAWRAARDSRARFALSAGGPFEHGRIVTLKGRLESGAVGCARFEDGTKAAVSSVRTRTLAAVVSGQQLVLRGAQTVRLEGPVEVLVGSRLSARGQRLCRLSDATVQRIHQSLAVEPSHLVWFQSLSEGDPIWVQGLLLSESSEIGKPAEWRLVAEHERIPLAFCGVPRVTHAGWWRSPVGVMAAVVLYFGLAKLAYTSGAYAMASATPYRALALQRLRDRLSLAAEHDPKAIDGLETVQGLRGDYCHLLSRLRELGQLDRATRVGPRCDDPAERDALALCFMRQGRFADASALLERIPRVRGKLFPGVDLAVSVHLLANQSRRALSRLEYLSQLDTISGIPAEVANETKARVQCLRLALRARLDHDPESLASLRKRSEAPLAQYACTVLYAELVQGQERVRALESCNTCRTKHTILTLPWLLGVEAACPRGQEESQRCLDWLLEAKPALRHPQWDETQPLPWVLYAIPSLESEVSGYLVELSRHSERARDAWTWVRDRMGVFHSVTAPTVLHRIQPLLDEVAKARDAHEPLPEASKSRLRELLIAGTERPWRIDAPPALRKLTLEQNTCYRPRGWYDRELEPRRMLANLLWTAYTSDGVDQPELSAQIWITASAFASALTQRDTIVALMALYH